MFGMFTALNTYAYERPIYNEHATQAFNMQYLFDCCFSSGFVTSSVG